MSRTVAKVAVAAAPYWVDRPFDYLVPDELHDRVVPGVRVSVPFSRGNRRSEGFVLSLSENSEYDQLKAVTEVFDEEPLLSEEQLRLGLFMHDRFFCTVYQALRSMLPAGIWLKEDGTRRVNDKTVEMVSLAVSAEEAAAAQEAMHRSSPSQARMLELLCAFEALSVKDLLTHAGSTRPTLKKLVSQELVTLYELEVFRRPEVYADACEELPQLNARQQEAFDGLNALAQSGKPQCALLFGVTGSGKTSVYIHLIQQQLQKGHSAILLVPEIALTPQMIQTFSSYFGNDVAVLHSSLTVAERYDEWKRIRKGKAHVVIGTRSAIFAPAQKLGLIIIDEEQEESYRSESTPRYHAVDIAKFRCTKGSFMLLLGSATPDIGTRYKAEKGIYSLFELPERYNAMQLPKVEIVDLKAELRRGNGRAISSRLYEELKENIARGEQSILFVNRRGTNSLITCADCGYTYQCPRCSVNLTYHSARERLICHHCGYSRRKDAYCPDCDGTLMFTGVGTQKVVEELEELFPKLPVLRMDTDTVTPAGSHEALFEKFRKENIPVMVGTQMVTKGLNFENVTLVGVLSADQSLHSSDYRAAERTFSLITQVIGRSGRGSKPGRAIIQTFQQRNETIVRAAEQDYMGFYYGELLARRLCHVPPYADLLAISGSSVYEDILLKALYEIKRRLEQETMRRTDIRILGPAPLTVVRVNNRFRYRILIACKNDRSIRSLIAALIAEYSSDKRFRSVSFFGENDPAD